jgi:AcrR family transcriptional regulator
MIETGRRLPTAERRDQLAAAALRILADRGFAALTAKNLGNEVGITDGAVFKHFSDKESIIEAAIDMFEELLQIPATTNTIPPMERLRVFFVGRLSLMRERPEILELAFTRRLESADGAPGVARVRRTMNSSITFIRTCLREAQKRGEIGDRASPVVLTWMVQGVLQGSARRRASRSASARIWEEVSGILQTDNA